MNTTKKLICILTAGAALGATAPVLADSFHDSGYDHYRHGVHYRDYGHHVYLHHDRRHLVVVQRPVIVQRPYIVEPPLYYTQPPMANIGMGAMIGAAIGGIIDSRQ